MVLSDNLKNSKYIKELQVEQGTELSNTFFKAYIAKYDKLEEEAII